MLSKVEIKSYYNHVLIDEGQDFPSTFYELCFLLAKGDRDHKSIVWAYDELQNVLDIKIRNPEALFGKDADGEYRVSLDRTAGSVPPGSTNDSVLSKCYRNQREVLVSAHALGFGVYGEIVQVLESADHWQDVGYDVLTGPLETGKVVRVSRPKENSPLSIDGGIPLISWKAHQNIDYEVAWVVAEVRSFIKGGLAAEEVVVISLDDRHARNYFSRLSEALSEQGIATNNIIADPYNEPPFTLAGMVTLSTVYRAKGNEAAAIIVLGVDAVSTRTRAGRNKIFTAFTRSKAWLRVSGISPKADGLFKELAEATRLAPEMKFIMPDLEEVEFIQRDLSSKQVKAKAARDRFIRDLRAAGLTDEDIEVELASGLK